MKKEMLQMVLLTLLIFFGFVLSSHAASIQMGFYDFYSEDDVALSTDGTTVSFTGIGGVLSSDPYYYGDPGVEVPADLVSLSFDFDFQNLDPSGMPDVVFSFAVYSGDTGEYLGGSDYFDFTQATYTLDLTTINPATTLLGLEFDLAIYDDSDVAMTISNFCLNTADAPAPVPEPSTVVLIGMGLIGFFSRKTKKANA